MSTQMISDEEYGLGPLILASGLDENDTIPVYISAPLSPTTWYVVVRNPDESESEPDHLSSVLTVYLSCYGLHFTFQNWPAVGTVCAAQYSFDLQWYRVCVISEPRLCIIASNPHPVVAQRVFFLDFGNEEDVLLTSLRKLDRYFSKKPARAVLVSLSGVIPVNSNNSWSEADTNAMKAWTSTTTLIQCRDWQVSSKISPRLVEIVPTDTSDLLVWILQTLKCRRVTAVTCRAGEAHLVGELQRLVTDGFCLVSGYPVRWALTHRKALQQALRDMTSALQEAKGTIPENVSPMVDTFQQPIWGSVTTPAPPKANRASAQPQQLSPSDADLQKANPVSQPSPAVSSKATLDTAWKQPPSATCADPPKVNTVSAWLQKSTAVPPKANPVSAWSQPSTAVPPKAALDTAWKQPPSTTCAGPPKSNPVAAWPQPSTDVPPKASLDTAWKQPPSTTCTDPPKTNPIAAWPQPSMAIPSKAAQDTAWKQPPSTTCADPPKSNPVSAWPQPSTDTPPKAALDTAWKQPLSTTCADPPKSNPVSAWPQPSTDVSPKAALDTAWKQPLSTTCADPPKSNPVSAWPQPSTDVSPKAALDTAWKQPLSVTCADPPVSRCPQPSTTNTSSAVSPKVKSVITVPDGSKVSVVSIFPDGLPPVNLPAGKRFMAHVTSTSEETSPEVILLLPLHLVHAADALFNSLNNFYSTAKDLPIRQFAPSDLCCVKLAQHKESDGPVFCRAHILNVSTEMSDAFDCLLLDMGTIECGVKAGDIRTLVAPFNKIPSLTVWCRLASVLSGQTDELSVNQANNRHLQELLSRSDCMVEVELVVPQSSDNNILREPVDVFLTLPGCRLSVNEEMVLYERDHPQISLKVPEDTEISVEVPEVALLQEPQEEMTYVYFENDYDGEELDLYVEPLEDEVVRDLTILPLEEMHSYATPIHVRDAIALNIHKIYKGLHFSASLADPDTIGSRVYVEADDDALMVMQPSIVPEICDEMQFHYSSMSPRHNRHPFPEGSLVAVRRHGTFYRGCVLIEEDMNQMMLVYLVDVAESCHVWASSCYALLEKFHVNRPWLGIWGCLYGLVPVYSTFTEKEDMLLRKMLGGTVFGMVKGLSIDQCVEVVLFTEADGIVDINKSLMNIGLLKKA